MLPPQAWVPLLEPTFEGRLVPPGALYIQVLLNSTGPEENPGSFQTPGDSRQPLVSFMHLVTFTELPYNVPSTLLATALVPSTVLSQGGSPPEVGGRLDVANVQCGLHSPR